MADAAANLNAIPEQYQSQLDRIALRKQLAAALLKQGQTQQQGQMVGGRYIAPSWINGLTNIGSSLAGALALKSSLGDQAQVMNQYQTDRAADFQKVNGLLAPKQETQYATPDDPFAPGAAPVTGTKTIPGDEQAAIRAASSSQFPQIQALAKQLMDSRDKRLGEVVRVASPASAIQFGQTGDASGLTPGTIGGPTELKDSNGNVIGSYITQPDGKATFVPKGVNVTTNVGDKGALKWLEGYQAPLETGRVAAQKAADTLPKVADLYSTVNSLQTINGQFADQKIAAAKFARALGLQVDPSVPASEFFRAQVQPMIGQMLHDTTGSQQVSDADRDAAAKALPSLGLEPAATAAILKVIGAGALKTISNHNNLVGKVSAASANVPDFPQGMVDPYRVDMTVKTGQDPYKQKFMDSLIDQSNTGYPIFPGDINPNDGTVNAPPGTVPVQPRPAARGKW